MPDAAPKPERVLERLEELSVELAAAVVLDERGRVAASTEPDEERATELGEALTRVLDRARGAAGPELELSGQVEVSTADGAVFAARRHGLTVGVVADRLTLSSLIFHDLRSALSGVGSAAEPPQ